MNARVWCFPLTLVLAVLLIAPAQGEEESTLTAVGDPLPDIDLSTTDGVRITNESLKGKVTVINLFATWCGPCKRELPDIEAIWKEHQDGEFALVVVGREHDEVELNAYRKETGYTFPLAADPDRETFSKFATKSIPRTYVVDRDGTIVYQVVGYYPEEIDKLKSVIEDALGEKAVAKAATKEPAAKESKSRSGLVQNVEVSGSVRIRAQHRDN